MGRYDDAAIDAYVATGSPFGQGGGVRGSRKVGDRWVTSVTGPYSNVVGLPLGATRVLLGAFGVPLLPVSDLEARDGQ
jgi:septum formation protein